MTNNQSTAVSRRGALVGLGAGGLGLSLATARPAAAQDAAAELASHPIVGAWLVMNPTDPPRASGASFTADSIMTISDAPSYVDPAFGIAFAGASIGTWEPTGERSIRFTLVQPLSDGAGAFTLEPTA